jgi:serine/threonine-protein kinase
MADGPKTLADRYELLTTLGQGGMGVVWRALDTRLGRSVAVKLLPKGAVGSDVARARLLREARAAAGLEHEGIVHVYDVGETPDGGAFLVMELIRGRSLRDALLAGEELSVGRKIAVIVAAARALAFAHRAGITHRDVKPDNIMIRDDGRVAVVDFGVAKTNPTSILGGEQTVPGITENSLTAAGALVGTPAYLAPEQTKGDGVDARTDQFALAVTAFETLAGQLPWKGDGVIEVVAAMLRDEPPSISTAAGLPASFDPVFARALAKKPADRFRDIEAFADALENAAADLPPERQESKARPSERAARKDVAPPTGAPAITDTKGVITKTPQPVAPRSTVRYLVAAAAAIVLIVAVAVGARTRGSATAVTAEPARPLACPSFSVTGIDEPWLGAAAAALACERAQLAHGGLDAQTTVPAELLGVPRDITLTVPDNLIEGTAPRERAIAKVKQLRSRWLDGRLERRADGYGVHISLRDADDRLLREGHGSGIEIFEAVRDAMTPLLVEEVATDDERSAMVQWLDVTSAADLGQLLDVRTAILIEDPVSLKHACEGAAKRSGLAPRVAYLAKAMCARKLRTGAVTDIPMPAVDETTPGALITTSLAQGMNGGPDAVRARADRLEKAMETASSAEGKARLAAAAAEIYNLIGDEHARSLARRSIQASPKAFDWRTSHWHRVAFASDGDEALGRSVSAWQPWEPVSQSLRITRGVLSDLTVMNESIRRSFYLSQRGYYANAYGEQLLTNGDVERARGVAELTDDDLLRVSILVAEAKYGAAYTTIARMLEALPGTEEKAAHAFRLALYGVRVSETLGRSADFVRFVVDKYVTSEPHHIVDAAVPFSALVSSCCFAPRAIGRPCIERIQRLRTEGKLPTIYKGVENVVNGAVYFVADDYAGAARTWRQLLRAPGWIQEPLRDMLAVAFDRSGMPELGDELDAAAVAAIDLPRPAELAWVRAARRAQKRGDNARARKIATAVVDKWRFADEDLPAMREMKDLLAKLPP